MGKLRLFQGAWDLGKKLFGKGASAGDAVADASPSLWSKIGAPLKGAAKLGTMVGAPIALVATGVSVAQNGVKDTLVGVGESLGLAASDVSTTTGLGQQEGFFYKLLAAVARGLKHLGVGGGIPEAIMKFADKGIIGAKNPEENGGFGRNADSSILGSNLGSTGPGWGSAAAAVTLGAGGLGAYNAWKKSGTPVAGGGAAAPSAHEAPGVAKGAAGAVDDVARGANAASNTAGGLASRFKGLLGRLPVVGKWFGVAATVGGISAIALGSDSAEAATLSTTEAGTTAGTKDAGTLQVSEIAGLGLSTLGATTAAQSLAPAAAATIGKLGLKAVPGVSAIIAAGETIYHTANHTLQGEFGKAGLSLVSGVGETVAGIGGAATYLTLGTAWREGVRAVGAKVFGEENTINHSLAVSVTSLLKDSFTGASTNATAPDRKSVV